MGKNLFKLNKRIVKLVLLFTSCALIVITIAVSNTYGNVSLLEKYNFEEGGYAVLGKIYHDQGHPLQRSLGNFYTDDIDLLNELKKTWVTEKPAPAYFCGYHYEICVVKNGKALWSFAINLDDACNTVVFDRKSYYFDPKKLNRYEDKFKNPNLKVPLFESHQAARQFLKELPPDPNLLMYSEPEWVKYDGEFEISVPCNQLGYFFSEEDKCLEEARRRISEKYPNRIFEIEYYGSSANPSDPSKDKIYIRVKCLKEMYLEFDIFPIDSKWKPYPLYLNMYYKPSAK